MFGLKSKSKETVSECRNIEVRLDDKVLFSGDLMDLPLKDEWVIKKSIEFFNDPEPCFIHRSAVTIRLLNEIWDSAIESGMAESVYIDYPLSAVVMILNRF